MNFRHSFYKAGLATGVAGALALGLFANSRPALAYTPSASGQPGLVQVPVTQGAYTGAGWPQITFPRRYAWRTSGYAGTQDIVVTYRVTKYNSVSRSWPLYTSHAISARVAPDGVGAWFTGWYFPVPLDSFSVDVLVEWNAVDGNRIGWKLIDYNAATDYQCLTGSTCSVMNNATIGAFIYLHPVPQPVVVSQPTQSSSTTQSAGHGTFVVGGTGPDLGTGTGSGGGQTFTVIPTFRLDKYDRLVIPGYDSASFGFGVSVSAQKIAEAGIWRTLYPRNMATTWNRLNSSPWLTS